LQAHTLENIQASIQEGCEDNNQDNNFGNLIICEGDLVLSTPPKVFVWSNELDYVVDSLIKVKLDEGDPKEMLDAVEELQSALGDLEGMVVGWHTGTCVTMPCKF
jgi:hypothetical protein